jgi:hypothetical protein
MMRCRVAWLVALFAGASAAATACSLTVSTDGLTGGDPDAAGGDGSASDALPDVHIFDSPTGACACLTTPAGWVGPLALWDEPTTAPTCGSDYPRAVLDGFSAPIAPPATCGCACDAPVVASGGACPSSFQVQIFDNVTCTGTACDTVTVTSGAVTCTSIQTRCSFGYGMLAQPAAPAASCTSRPSKAVAPLAWSRVARACEIAVPPTQGACGSGAVCVPLPHAPMAPRPCVMTSGDVACPAGGYAVRHVYYGSATDSRDCTACACGPSPTSCAGTISECPGASIPIPAACAKLTDPTGLKLNGSVALDAGACPSSGSQPTGALTPTQPTTVCCVP